ncbi:MAG: M48 family metalloprotease, partial [Saprospiraceae bacterium]|nr:M48 family metalloprotease [Saprospiraceae bacterium]
VANEVGTHFPRKIFLIPDVNASVFYSSSFWSLFIPTRKNLNIGLGLVNSVNISEFKAVLAHEFGHFSQKSMRLGSYVYYVNQVIFNMLYQNNGWISAANGIANIHGILSFFVQVAAYIVQGVQWVLRGMYGFVNRRYLSLSRAMEFHADTISASVSGSNNMTQALRQIELGAMTYQQVIQKCNELLVSEQAPLNCYVGQRVEAAHFAAVHKLPLHQGIPLVSRDCMEKRQSARVNFKNQWASHPTREEREDNLQVLDLTAPVQQDSAWSIFQNPSLLQQQLTKFLYRDLNIKVENIEDESFVKMIQEEQAHRKLPDLYEGYFDGHPIYTDKWEEAAAAATPKIFEPDVYWQLFAENLDEKIGALQHDVYVLKAINEGQVDTKTFDFDGQKYTADQAPDICRQIEKDIADTLETRNARDTTSISAFFAHAQTKSAGQVDKLKSAYKALHEVMALKNTFLPPASEVFATINLIASNDYNLATDMTMRFKELYTVLEPQLRGLFMHLPDLDLFPENLQQKIREVFTGEPIEYHQYNQPSQAPLEALHALIAEIAQFLDETAFERQKLVLVLQQELVD